MVQLPDEVRPAKRINPKMTIIYSLPKTGKTTICAQLPNSLILECEPGGADFVEGKVMEIARASEFEQALDLIKQAEDLKYDYLIVDTITKLDEWSEIVGTYAFMNKTQGKKWNRENEDPNGKIIHFTDPRFESVHELGQGFGYKYSREVMEKWYDKLEALVDMGKVKGIILLAHIKDKLVETKIGNAVEVSDLNLTGKVKSQYTSRVDAIGYLSRKQGKCILNFNNDLKVLSGGRCPHLNGEIVISEKKPDGSIVTNWDKVFL